MNENTIGENGIIDVAKFAAGLPDKDQRDMLEDYKMPIGDLVTRLPYFGKVSEKEQYILGKTATGEFVPENDEQWAHVAGMISHSMLGVDDDYGGQTLAQFLQTEDFTVGEEYKDVDREKGGLANPKRVVEMWRKWLEYSRGDDEAKRRFIEDNFEDKEFLSKNKVEQEKIAARALGMAQPEDLDLSHTGLAEAMSDDRAIEIGKNIRKAKKEGLMLTMGGGDVSPDVGDSTIAENVENAVDVRADAIIDQYIRTKGDRLGVANLDAALNILHIPSEDGSWEPDRKATAILSEFVRGRGVDFQGRLIPGNFVALRDGCLDMIEEARATDAANGDGENGPAYKAAWASCLRAVRAANLVYKTEGFMSGKDDGVVGRCLAGLGNGINDVEDLVSSWIDGTVNGTVRAYNAIANRTWRAKTDVARQMEAQFIEDAAITAATANVVEPKTWYEAAEREAMKFYAWGKLFRAGAWAMGKAGIKAVNVGANASELAKAQGEILEFSKKLDDATAAAQKALGGVQNLAEAGKAGEQMLEFEAVLANARTAAQKAVGYDAFAQIADHARNLLTQAPTLFVVGASDFEGGQRGKSVQLADVISMQDGFDVETAKIAENFGIAKTGVVTAFMAGFAPLLKQLSEGTIGTSATQKAASSLLKSLDKAAETGDLTELRAWMTGFAIAGAGAASPAVHAGVMIGAQNASVAVVDEMESAVLNDRPVDMESMRIRVEDAAVDGLKAGVMGTLPFSMPGAVGQAVDMKLPTLARRSRLHHATSRIAGALGGIDYEEHLKSKPYNELNNTDKSKFNLGMNKFGGVLRKIIVDGEGKTAEERVQLLKDVGVPENMVGLVESLAKDVEYATKHYRMDARLVASTLEGKGAYKSEAEAVDFLRRAGYKASIETGKDGVKYITLGATVRGTKVSGKFLYDNGEVKYVKDGKFESGAARQIVEWYAGREKDSSIADIVDRLNAIKMDTTTDESGKTRYERLLDGEDVDGILTDMKDRAQGLGVAGVFVSPEAAEKGDANAEEATKGGAVAIEDGLIRLSKGDVETLIHEPTHAIIDLLEKAGAITPDERAALESADFGETGWNEAITKAFGLKAADEVIASKAKEIALEANQGLKERLVNGAIKLLGMLQKVKVAAGDPVASFDEFFTEQIAQAQADREEEIVREKRDKQLEDAAKEAEKAAKEAVGEEVVAEEHGTTDEADLTLEEMAERQSDEEASASSPNAEGTTTPVEGAESTEAAQRSSDAIPTPKELAQRAIAYRTGIADELFDGGARDFLGEFAKDGLTPEAVLEAMGYAHDTENGMWVHRDSAKGLYDKAVAREAQRKAAAGIKLNGEERRRIGIVTDANGVMTGVGIRIDGEIDGSEIATTDEAQANMRASGARWRPLAADESVEVMDAVKRQLNAETAKFNFLTKTKEWYPDSILKSFDDYPADWTKYEVKAGGVSKLTLNTRFAEAVDRIENPKGYMKVFLPTGEREFKWKTADGRDILVARDINIDINKKDSLNDVGKGGMGIHILDHIAECGYATTKSVLTAKEVNDYFDACLETPVYFDENQRPQHELKLPTGTTMRIGTRFVDKVEGGRKVRYEVPVTVFSTRNEGVSKAVCAKAAKEMSARQTVRISENGAASSEQTGESIAKRDLRVNGQDYTMLGETEDDLLSKGVMTRTVGPAIDKATGGYPNLGDGTSLFNWVGTVGLRNALKYRDANGKPIITERKIQQIEERSRKAFEDAVARIAAEPGRDNRTNVRNWEVEKDLGAKGFDVGLPRVGHGKDRLRLHFTGAFKDGVPRFEYSGKGAKVKVGMDASIAKGEVTVGDIVADADMKAYYPELYDSPVVMGGERGYALGTITLRGLYKNGNEAKVNNRELDKLEVTVPKRDGTEPIVRISNNGAFIIFADKITKENRKRIEADMNTAVAAAIARIEGWDMASNFKSEYNPKAVFTGRDWTKFMSHTGLRTYFGRWYYSNYDSEFKYHLFGDKKTQFNDPKSVVGKAIKKTIDEILPTGGKARTKERAEAKKAVKDAIVDMLSGTYNDFASVLEARAMGARMGKKADSLMDFDDSLIEADREGFIRARQGQWSEEASRRVLRFWEKDVADAIAKVLKNPEVAEVFSNYFKAEVNTRTNAALLDNAMRKVNPRGVRTKTLLEQVNKARAKLGMEPLTEAQWENWRSMGGDSDKVGRPAYTEEQKRLAEANRKPSWGVATGKRNKDGSEDVSDIVENQDAAKVKEENAAAQAMTIAEREAANEAVYGKDTGKQIQGKDEFKNNEQAAYDALAKKLASTDMKDTKAVKDMLAYAVQLVNHFSGKDAILSEKALIERAQGLVKLVMSGKRPKADVGAKHNFVGADFTTRMITASASKLAYEALRRRKQPDAMIKATEAVKAQMKKEAAKLRIPEADRELWADTVVSSAMAVAEDVVSSLGDKIDAKSADITKNILDRVEAQAEQRRIASAIYSQFTSGYAAGARGERAIEIANASLERERMASIRAAKGLSTGEVNAMVGFDTLGAIADIGSNGARYATGRDMAEDMTGRFCDGYRSAHPEAATSTDAELLDDPTVRKEYAQTIGSLINNAAKSLAYGRTRTLAVRDAATLRQTLPPTVKTVERTFAHYAEMISEGIARLDVQKLVKNIERMIDSQAAGGKRVVQGASRWERDIAPHLQEFWKYVKDVMYKSSDWCDEEAKAIQKRLGATDEEIADIAAETPNEAARDKDMERDIDMMKLRAIKRYGALTSRPKADVVDIISNDITPGIDAATREYLEYRVQRREADAVRRDILVKGLKPYRDGDYKIGPGRERARKFLFWNMPDMFAKFGAYFKEGSEAKMLVDGMARDFSTAHLEMNRIVSDMSIGMVKAVEQATGMRYEDFLSDWLVERPEYAHLSRSDYAVPKTGARTVEVWTGKYAQRADAKRGIKKGDKIMRTVSIAESGVDDSMTKTAQSKLSLLYAYAAHLQRDMEINNVVYSRDAAWKAEVEGIIGHEGIQLAAQITALYDQMRAYVSPVSERITGEAVLSPDPRYCPLFFEQRPNASLVGKFSVSKFPTFLTERQTHDYSRLQEGVNILDVLTRRIRDTAHYAAFGELADKVKTTFADGRVMAQYYNVLGSKTAKALYRQLNDAFNGGEESLDTMGMTLRNIVTHTTLGFNPASAIKQLEGIGGWKLMMGTRSWLGALTWDRSVLNSDVAAAMTDLRDVFATRGHEGITEPMQALVAAKERAGHRGAMRWYTDNSMMFTRFFDKVSVSTCAAQYYLGRLEYYRAQGIDEARYTDQLAMYKRSGWDEARAKTQARLDAKMSEAEAKRAAIADTDYAIQITQTSGRQEFLHQYQRSNIGGKMLSQFAGPRFTRLGIEIDAAHRAFALGEKGAAVNFMSKFFTGHVICPAILATASHVTQYLFGRRDDKNAKMFDGFAANLAISMAFGPWSGMLILGSLLDSATRSAVNKAQGGYGSRRAVEIPMTSKLSRLLDLSTTTAVDACRLFTARNVGKQFMRTVYSDLIDDIQAVAPATKLLNVPPNMATMIDQYLKEAEKDRRR